VKSALLKEISISINSKSTINSDTTSFPRLYIPHRSSDSEFKSTADLAWTMEQVAMPPFSISLDLIQIAKSYVTITAAGRE
jgi:hypothetical protein